MNYFILMVGDYEDRDPALASSNLDEFKKMVQSYIENWAGPDYLYEPSSIIVLKGRRAIKECYPLWNRDYKTVDGFNQLFEEIENYTKEEI